jgi:hypothetical protein
MIGSVLKSPPKHMEALGFVSKKERLEKVHPRWLTARASADGILIQRRVPATFFSHSFVTFLPFEAGYTGPGTPFRPVSCLYVEP